MSREAAFGVKSKGSGRVDLFLGFTGLFRLR